MANKSLDLFFWPTSDNSCSENCWTMGELLLRVKSMERRATMATVNLARSWLVEFGMLKLTGSVFSHGCEQIMSYRNWEGAGALFPSLRAPCLQPCSIWVSRAVYRTVAPANQANSKGRAKQCTHQLSDNQNLVFKWSTQNHRKNSEGGRNYF